eukprot:gnl/TRDRNA2_/TRDRNA2_146706_c0_seq2.p1 gnl/TRDRNA2_/TRDRNA2_146706_c0~~gnl/TRDRNA2_/TRDRNA2_146706_c0_seq2.p1  ORF type:complete len:316 (+),score=32.10 gnl/TRDRNA2_/TRDRNA2_146706_c0_seq2:1-948(+)
MPSATVIGLLAVVAQAQAQTIAKLAHGKSPHVNKNSLVSTAGSSDALRHVMPTEARTSALTLGYSRRELLRSAGTGLLSAIMVGSGTRPALAETFPTTLSRSQVGLDRDGRLQKCPVNFNCVSTSSNNPDQYGALWSTPKPTLDGAVSAITAAVRTVCPEAKVDNKTETASGGRYIRFLVKGKLGIDVLEFVVKNNTIGDRNWEGDRPSERLVTYRSVSTTVKYVYPFYRPVSDFGEQRKRLEMIRQELGWSLVGCELGECYAGIGGSGGSPGIPFSQISPVAIRVPALFLLVVFAVLGLRRVSWAAGQVPLLSA